MRQTAPMDQTVAATGMQEEAAPKVSTIAVIAGLSLAVLMPSLATSSVNAALPALTNAFQAPFQAVQWVIIAYMLAITSTIVAVGRVGDVVGRSQLMVAGVVTFTTASLLCGLAPDLSVLIAARCAQGLGAAVMMALAMTFVGEVFPKEQTGRAMGLLGTMSAIGTTMGPSLGGILIAFSGWPIVFLVNVPLGLITIVLLRHGLPVAERPIAIEARRFDVAGIILLAITLGAFALAMTTDHGQSAATNLGLLIAVFGAGALFVLVEIRSASPLVDLGLVRNIALRAGLAANVIVSAVMMATLIVGPFYLTRALQLDVASAGIALSAGPFVAAIAGLPAGRLVDRIGTARTSRVGLFMMIAGSLALGLITPGAGIVGYLVPIAMLTAGYATFQAANNTAVISAAGSSERGVVSGLLNLSRNIGLMTGASAMGAVFMAGVAEDVSIASPEAIATGMRTTFIVATVLIAFAVAIGLLGSRDLGAHRK